MLTESQLNAFRAILGAGNVLTEAADCWAYSYDNSRHYALPEAVAFATDHDCVIALVRACNEFQVPLTVRGRGTGTAGASVPVMGGIVLSLERMDRIIEIDPANRLVVAEPGVTNQALQDAAAKHGFFWPPDPTSAAFCTIGGNLACNSAGPRAVKYGTARENTLGLKSVTGNGQGIITGVRTSKGVVGYDLTRLIVGSEGTLAVITEATLKLTPLPESQRTLQAVYSSVSAAAQAVSSIMAQPVIPAALEFMDGAAIEMSRSHAPSALPKNAGALLMIEVDGPAACLDSAVSAVSKAASVEGCLGVKIAVVAEDVEALWATRRALSPALRSVAPKKINEDVVVPVSRIPELIDSLQQLADKHRIPIVNFGHAGNGNLHVNLLMDPADKDQVARAERCLDEVFTVVLGLDGTLSGEHGIGLVKRDFVPREIAPTTLELMRRIKRQFDPNGILNPGKTLPMEGATTGEPVLD